MIPVLYYLCILRFLQSIVQSAGRPGMAFGNSVICEELQVLEAVFCQEGEFKLHGLNEREGSAAFSIHTTIHVPSSNAGSSNQSLAGSASKPAITVNFELGPDYPTTFPTIAISCNFIRRKTISDMKRDLHEYANENLLGDPMVMQIVEWIQEHAHEYANEGQTMNQSQVEDKKDLTISLLLLDHMRARSRYVRTLTSWCSELGLMGRIFFADKLILILLEGSTGSSKEFIVRLKTQKVDVDSSGKSCKEKMMSVLSEAPSVEQKPRFQSFEVKDLKTEELRATFEDAKLLELYNQHVRPLYKHSSNTPGR